MLKIDVNLIRNATKRRFQNVFEVSVETAVKGKRRFFIISNISHSKFGKLVVCRVMVDSETKQCRGYGFIEFANPDSVKIVMNSGM